MSDKNPNDTESPCAMDTTSTGEPSNKIDLREISITLDAWSRTCDQVLTTLDEQVDKILKKKK